jgi:hypothetical protein
MGGNVSRSYPVACFGTGGVETLGFAAIVSVN